ncbi:MAG: single-stranded-DNA-specific exonuclease RecJ [Deltaproteobacteria bacterium]|nr:single-stranded-DNA-specific exonuclease RecJ [Deltaproteobacteria bacterium]
MLYFPNGRRTTSHLKPVPLDTSANCDYCAPEFEKIGEVMNPEQKLPTTKWSYHGEQPELCEELADSLSIGAIVSRVLINRGVDSVDKCKKFLSPSLNDMHNPNLMQDMLKGVERVIQAVTNGEKITIYGDYDADGVTSVALLVLFLRTVGAKVNYYIPDRVSEGYGLNKQAVANLAEQGTSLLITVDCGISDYDCVVMAKAVGMDVIIVDHHEVPKQIPPACAIINPLRPDCRFPFKQLAAVGIVFNFVVSLRGAMRPLGFWSDNSYPNLKEYLDLVAIGTIGDIVPIVDENRLFVKFGLELMSSQRRIGIRALKEIVGLDRQTIDISQSSYILIPRINAAGRVAKSDDAVDLFLSENMEEAKKLAQRLDSFNRKRQEIERGILSDITRRIERIGDIGRLKSLVFASENWHPGVIGVVASRIVNRFLRPTFVISVKGGVGKGSGRSFAGIDIYQSLCECDSLLLSFGGHRNAAGISIRQQNIEKFSASINESIANSSSSGDFIAKTIIDAACPLKDINDGLVSQLSLLAPFGSGNPEPILCSHGALAKSLTVVGNNHLRMRLGTDDGTSLDSIWYGRGNFLKSISNTPLAVAFNPQMSHWKGQSGIQLKMFDIDPL